MEPMRGGEALKASSGGRLFLPMGLKWQDERTVSLQPSYNLNYGRQVTFPELWS